MKAVAAWRKVHPDPNEVRLRESLADHVRAAWRFRWIDDRGAFFGAVCRGKRVLDVGVVEHHRGAWDSPEWLHGHIAASAKACVGVDILEEEVEGLRRRGFDVRVHDFCEGPLAETFEVIVCGEVLAHVANPTGFLRNLRGCLGEGGQLYLTVPNPWYVGFMLKGVWRGSVYQESVDHVAWFDAQTVANLAGRAGLVLLEYFGVRVTRVHSFRARVLLYLFKPLVRLGVKHELFCKSMVYGLGVAP